MSIIFKDPDKMEKEYWLLTPKMRLILSEAEFWCFKHGKGMIVTCLIRSPEEQEALFEAGQAEMKTSVHMYGRGADVRLLMPEELNQQLVDFLNMKFVYDNLRPPLKTAIIHGGTSLHIHLQSMA